MRTNYYVPYARCATKPRQPWIRQLHEAYQRFPQRSKTNPWTTEYATMLGMLYRNAYGELPPVSRMRATYCLPEYHTIIRLFGDTATYYAGIQAAMEEGSCTT